MGMFVGCPHCKVFRTLDERTVGFICSSCGKYVNEENMLPEEKFDDNSSATSSYIPKMGKERINAIDESKKKAETWAKDVEKGKHPYYDPIDRKKVQ